VRAVGPITALALLVLSGSLTSAAWAASTPTLQPASVKGFQLAVAGTGWPAKARVTFTLRLGATVYGMELRTTKHGSFEVGARHVDFCHGSRFWARDLSGDQVFGPVGDPYCPPNSYTSNLIVLHGKRMKPKITRIQGSGTGKPVVILQGNGLYLFEQGESTPAYVPSAPHRYFSLIQHGRLAVACSGSTLSCTPGFYWEWIGMAAGKTPIVLRPPSLKGACDKSCVRLDVQIKPRPSG